MPRYRKDCPFCPGNEEMTPAASLELTDEARAKWSIRAFPNRYAVLTPNPEAPSAQSDDRLVRLPARGVHEVIVESPLHNRFPDRRTPEEFVGLIRAYQLRSAAAMALPGVAYALVFKNHGAGAGTSLVHPHSQIIATPVLPARAERTAQRADEHWRDTGRCLTCEVADGELTSGNRVVLTTDNFAVVEPFAAGQPAETWIMPIAHATPFVTMEIETINEFAGVLQTTLRLVSECFGDPDYNYALHQEPPDETACRCQHWYLQVLPRLKEPAGFELGSGMAINTLSPEVAAERMRGPLGGRGAVIPPQGKDV